MAVNPYQWLDLYTPDIMRRYHNRPLGTPAPPPHCFAVAEDGYLQVADARQSASIIICGESGAGKTQTTKLMLRYLSHVASPGDDGDEGGMSQRIMESNPLMEAFGNAKTVRRISPRAAPIARRTTRPPA